MPRRSAESITPLLGAVRVSRRQSPPGASRTTTASRTAHHKRTESSGAKSPARALRSFGRQLVALLATPSLLQGVPMVEHFASEYSKLLRELSAVIADKAYEA